MEKMEMPDKTSLYTYDPMQKYEYNINHGTQYPYNGLPKGGSGRIYKKTRFIRWNPEQEDIFIRHRGRQFFVNFEAVLPGMVTIPEIAIFQMKQKRVDTQNYICEQINFFTALYDDDNDLITSMWNAKVITDRQDYTMANFDEYADRITNVLFTDRTIEKIHKMVSENDVGDDVTGCFPDAFLHDMFVASFMAKVMHLYIEHFIILNGLSPKDLYGKFAHVYKNFMEKLEPNMYKTLYGYIHNQMTSTISSNRNVIDMLGIEGQTPASIITKTMQKNVLHNGLIKLTFASEWDKVNRRPVNSVVGFVKSIVKEASQTISRQPFRRTPVHVDDPAQLLDDTIDSLSPISVIRSYNPGEYMCELKDLNVIVADILFAMPDDINETVDFYMDNLPSMNTLAETLVELILYNKFHSSIQRSVFTTKQKYLVLLYVRNIIMDIYELNEYDSISKPHMIEYQMLNLLTARSTSDFTRSLTPKEIKSVTKYVKAGDLSKYILSPKSRDKIIESILNTVLSSYTIVNHNDHSLLNSPLIYDTTAMTPEIMGMIIDLFDYISREG